MEHDEKHPQPKFGGNRFMEAEIWPHEYLQNVYSPIEISVNWPGSKPGQFTLISMGLIRYACGHILGHHEPIHVKFGAWRFFVMLYRNMKKKIMKMLKCQKKKKIDDVTLWYSIRLFKVLKIIRFSTKFIQRQLIDLKILNKY